jgi:SAM-dependent methyltransferase
MKEVAEFYDFFPFPGRVVSTFELSDGLYKMLKLFVAKNTLFHKSNVKRIRKMFNYQESNPQKILDAACGTGELACLLAMAFPKAKVQSFDLSKGNLFYANKLKTWLNIENVNFFQYDLLSDEQLALENLDFIVCSGAVHHLTNPMEGLRRLGALLAPKGLLQFGVYGRSFYKEKILTEELCSLFKNLDLKHKSLMLKELGIVRQGIIQEIKRENKLKKHLSCILKGDLSYLGYELFPHHETSLQMDGFCHPSVKYYDPDSLFEDIENAGLELVKMQNISYPNHWLSNPFFQSMSEKDKFRLLDAYMLVPYAPLCKRAVI